MKNNNELLAHMINGQREIFEMLKEERPSMPWNNQPMRLTVYDDGKVEYAFPLCVDGYTFHCLKWIYGSTYNELYTNVLDAIKVRRWKPRVSTQAS